MMTNQKWKWWRELTPEEKVVASVELEKYPALKGLKIGWDGNLLWAYVRVPSQFYYLLNEDGSVPDHVQERLDSGQILDTKDGGFMVFVPVDAIAYEHRGYIYD